VGGGAEVWRFGPPNHLRHPICPIRAPNDARGLSKGSSVMSLLKWALVFLVIAGIAAVFGFTNIAEGAAEIAKILFFIFLAICVVLVILGMTVYRSVT
jgi:uncharacterized membrane protein YtjA (UPF0391 family)